MKLAARQEVGRAHRVVVSIAASQKYETLIPGNKLLPRADLSIRGFKPYKVAQERHLGTCKPIIACEIGKNVYLRNTKENAGTIAILGCCLNYC